MTARTKIPDGKWSGQIPDFARRIGEAARARRVVLFGSAARGDARENSDLDFLVIIPAGRHRRRAWRRADRAVHRGLDGPSMDIVVAREATIREHRDNPFMVYKPALDEGVEVWRAEESGAVLEWAKAEVARGEAK